MTRRVVVTGLGPVSSIGIGWRDFDGALRRGQSGITPLRTPTVQGFEVQNGGEVHGFSGGAWREEAPQSVGRCAALAIAGARLAVEDSGLPPDGAWAKNACLSVGNTDGEAHAFDEMMIEWIRLGVERIPPALVCRAAAESLGPSIADALGIGGETLSIATACAAGNYAIGHAFDVIAGGDAEVAVTGGAEAMARKSYAGFHRLGAISATDCKPFDAHRTGMIPAEGAGILVLESLEHARGRGARIHAELLGYGLSCDAKHPTSPDADSIVKCIRKAHRRAGVRPEEIDYICAHGTGTKINDRTEALAIGTVFADRRPPASSIKSMLGHTMGAASAFGTIACILSITQGYLPPTINCRSPDPECQIDCVPEVCRPADVRVAQNHGFAFGGNNAVLVLGRFEG